MKPITTKFILNDLIFNDKRIVITKKVTIREYDTKTKYVIDVNKNGTGMRMVYDDPQDVLNKFASLIKV